LFFVKPGLKVNGQYYWDILLSQQMLDAIKHITGDNIFFVQEDSTWTVRATQSDCCGALDFFSDEPCLQQPRPEDIDYNI